ITANFIEEMHEAVKNARDLVVLFTRDYEQSPYTRMEFTSFEANAAQSVEKRRMVILRCENAPLLGLFAPHVYQDLVGIGDAEERRTRILARNAWCNERSRDTAQAVRARASFNKVVKIAFIGSLFLLYLVGFGFVSIPWLGYKFDWTFEHAATL